MSVPLSANRDLPHRLRLFLDKGVLPGETAHRKLAPDFRPFPQWDQILASNPKWSAVLILLVWENDAWHISLIKRSTYAGVHSAQVSFPGGKREPTDPDFIFTALREAEEEIGVTSEEVSVLGEMSRIYIPPSHFAVQPVLAHRHSGQSIRLQDREAVEHILWPVEELLSQEVIPRKVQAGSREVEVPSFVTGGHICWGATAILLSELREILLSS